MSYVRREDVIGKTAVTPDGNSFGEVKDIAFSIDGSVGLVISAKTGSEVIIPIKQASAIGDFVLLSSSSPQTAPQKMTPPPQPKPVPVATPTNCPSCGSPLKPNAKFCGKCGHRLV
jgi:sporulation protein YlmC with PRC-barrel domain